MITNAGLGMNLNYYRTITISVIAAKSRLVGGNNYGSKGTYKREELNRRMS